jgi:hypothetical protein
LRTWWEHQNPKLKKIKKINFGIVLKKKPKTTLAINLESKVSIKVERMWNQSMVKKFDMKPKPLGFNFLQKSFRLKPDCSCKNQELTNILLQLHLIKLQFVHHLYVK